MRKLVLLSALALVAVSACSGSSSAASEASPLGRWITATGNLEVEVEPCGEALCGRVVRVLANHSMSRAGGEMKPADARDPLGMQILSEFKASEFRESPASGAAATPTRVPVQWEGRIYNRENAKTYRCRMHVSDAGELVLRGYIGIPLIGNSAIWTRPGVAVGGDQ